MEGNYKHRVVDALLERKLLGKGAVLVEGAKWCGKTTTSSRLAKSILKLGETSVLRSSRQLAEMNPALLLRGETPRLIDERDTNLSPVTSTNLSPVTSIPCHFYK